MKLCLSTFWLPFISFKKEPFHYLRFEKDSRYYELRLQQDLLSDWILILSNGRIKSKLGQTRTIAFETYNDALEFFYSTVKTRAQRFYQLKNCVIDDLLYISLLLNFYTIQETKPSRTITRKTPQKRAKSISKQRLINNIGQIGFDF